MKPFDPLGRLLKQHPLGSFFGLTFLLAWACWIPAALSSHGLIHLDAFAGPLRAAGIVAPAAAALVLTGFNRGTGGLIVFLQPLGQWRVKPVWYFVALFARVLILLAAWSSYLLVGQAGFPPPNVNLWMILQKAGLEFLVELPGSGLGEELGWTGFALPALLSRRRWFHANLILGLLWAAWHLPLFFIAGDAHYATSFALFTIKLVAFRFLFSWVYHHTQGSLLIVVLFHTLFNVALVLIPWMDPNDPLAIVLTWLTALLTLGSIKIVSGSTRQSQGSQAG